MENMSMWQMAVSAITQRKCPKSQVSTVTSDMYAPKQAPEEQTM